MIMTKRILTKACIYYSTITMILLSLLLIIGDDSDIMVITPFRFMLIFPYCVAIAFGNIFYAKKEIMEFARALCHYCCVALGFFAFMYIPSAKNAHGSEIIVALFTVSFVYIASYVVFAIVRSLKNRKKNKEKDYDSMFKK